MIRTRNSLEEKPGNAWKNEELKRDFSTSIISSQPSNSKVSQAIFKQHVPAMVRVEDWKQSQMGPLGFLSLVHLMREYTKKDTLYGKSLDIIESVSSEVYSTDAGKIFLRELARFPQSLNLNVFEFESKYAKVFAQLSDHIDADFRKLAKSSLLRLKEILFFNVEKSRKKRLRESMEDNSSMYSLKSAPSNTKRIMQVSKYRPEKPEESSQYTLGIKEETISSFRFGDGFDTLTDPDHPNTNDNDFGKLTFGQFNQMIRRNMQKNVVAKSDSFDAY